MMTCGRCPSSVRCCSSSSERPRRTSLPSSARALALLLALAASTSCAGETKVYWPGGIKRFEGGGIPGSETGLWTYWYHDGEIRERGRFSNGRRTGEWTQWYSNGQIASRGERRFNSSSQASERVGPWTFWHENGHKRAEGNYVEGERHGPWTFWKFGGALDPGRSGTYEHGVRSGP